MLNWFRVWASHIASAVVVAFVAVGGSAIIPHEDDCHDVACTAIFVQHDGSAHRIAAPPADSAAHGEHCLVCHWARSFRPRTEARIVSTPGTDVGTYILVESFTPSASAPVSQPPLRSPPATSVS